MDNTAINDTLKIIYEDNSYIPPVSISVLESIITYLESLIEIKKTDSTDFLFEKELEIWLQKLLKSPFDLKNIKNIKILEKFLSKTDKSLAILINNYILNNQGEVENFYSFEENDSFLKCYILGESVNFEVFLKFIENISKYRKVDERIYKFLKDERIIFMESLSKKEISNLKLKIFKNQSINSLIPDNLVSSIILELLKISDVILSENINLIVSDILESKRFMICSLVKYLCSDFFSNEVFIINLFQVLSFLTEKNIKLEFDFPVLEKFLFFDFIENNQSIRIREVSLFFVKSLLSSHLYSIKEKYVLLNYLINILLFDNSFDVRFGAIKVLNEFISIFSEYLSIEDREILNIFTLKTIKRINFIKEYENIFKISFLDENIFKNSIASKILSPDYNIHLFSAKFYALLPLNIQNKIDIKDFYKLEDIFIINSNRLESEKNICSVSLFLLFSNKKQFFDCLIFKKIFKSFSNFDHFLQNFLNTNLNLDLKAENIEFLVQNNLLNEYNFNSKILKEFSKVNSDFCLKLLKRFRNLSCYLMNILSDINVLKILKTLKFSNIDERILRLKVFKSFLILKDYTNQKEKIDNSILNFIMIDINNIIKEELNNYTTDFRGDISWNIRKEAILCYYLKNSEDLEYEFLGLLFGKSKFLREYLLALLAYSDEMQEYSIIKNKIIEFQRLNFPKFNFLNQTRIFLRILKKNLKQFQTMKI